MMRFDSTDGWWPKRHGDEGGEIKRGEMAETRAFGIRRTLTRECRMRQRRRENGGGRGKNKCRIAERTEHRTEWSLVLNEQTYREKSTKRYNVVFSRWVGLLTWSRQAWRSLETRWSLYSNRSYCSLSPHIGLKVTNKTLHFLLNHFRQEIVYIPLHCC